MAKENIVQMEVRMDASGAVKEMKDIASSFQDVAKAAEDLNQAVSSIAGELPDMHTGFDELHDILGNVSNELDALGETLAKPQETGFFESIGSGIGSLKEGLDTVAALENFGDAIGDNLEDLPEKIEPIDLVNLVFPDTIEAFEELGDALGKTDLANKLTPMVSGVTEAFGKIGQVFSGMSLGWGAAVVAVIAGISLLIVYWDDIVAFIQETVPKLMEAVAGWFGVFAPFAENFKGIVEGIKLLFDGLITFVTGVFTGNWETAWEGIVSIFTGIWTVIGETIKGGVNLIIGIINGVISAVVGLVNLVIRGLNLLSMEFPDLSIFGDMAGKRIGFHLKPLQAPMIPYLAKGAVLPANKPFLAMVGDQKHGTNVEAPLSTIQEAVALVMEEHTAANLAGQEAIVAVLRQILTAVLGIELGDDVLGQAVQRYERKMAVVRGGY